MGEMADMLFDEALMQEAMRSPPMTAGALRRLAAQSIDENVAEGFWLSNDEEMVPLNTLSERHLSNIIKWLARHNVPVSAATMAEIQRARGEAMFR